MRAVLIGNSAAALAAAESFRRYDQLSELILVAAEPGPAYSRALLPYYLRGSLPREKLFIRDWVYYERLRTQTRFGRAVTRVHECRRTLSLEGGEELPWDRLLVASGARPVLPQLTGLPAAGIHTLWTLKDADRLLPELLPGRRAVFLGAGFVGLQAAWAACARGLEVTVLETLPRVLPKVLDECGSALLEKRMRGHGVEVRCAVEIERIQSADADLVVVAAGVRPELSFLEGTSVAVAPGGAGILVDQRMRTSVPGIYAAGDAALGPSVFGEAHAAHALWPTAVEQGRVAGANLAGRERVYSGSLNMNVAELFGLTVASMGRFQESGDPAEEALVEQDPQAGRYVKLLYREGVPLGGVVLGSPEDLSVLAALRPRIRARRPGRLAAGRPFRALHQALALRGWRS